MAKIEAVKKVVSFTVELSEKEMGTIVSALSKDHSVNSEYAMEKRLPHLNMQGEAQLFFNLRDALEGVSK